MTLLVNIFLICLAWKAAQCVGGRDKVFFLQKSSGDDNKTLLVVTWTDSDDESSAGCEVFTDKELIDEVLLSSDDAHIRKVSEDQMQNFIGDCIEFTLRRRRREVGHEESTDTPMKDADSDHKELRRDRDGTSDGQRKPVERRTQNFDSRRPQGDRQKAPKTTTPKSIDTTETPTTLGYDGIPVIYPGTKWCGAGDMAKSYDDLGQHQDTDRCCRAHDFCNDTLAPGARRHNLTNNSPFTKLSCKCDMDFYDCLDRVNTYTSNTIGNMYFNVLKRECYKKEYPLTSKCKKYLTLLKLTCVEYERNYKAPKEYQWISAKEYKKTPFSDPLTVTLPF